MILADTFQAILPFFFQDPGPLQNFQMKKLGSEHIPAVLCSLTNNKAVKIDLCDGVEIGLVDPES